MKTCMCSENTFDKCKFLNINIRVPKFDMLTCVCEWIRFYISFEFKLLRYFIYRDYALLKNALQYLNDDHCSVVLMGFPVIQQ